jgi:hypothetical protein
MALASFRNLDTSFKSFSMPTLSKIIAQNLMLTWLISAALTFIICQIFNSDIISFEKTQGDRIETVVLIVWTMVLTITAFTAFLNRIRTVRDNILLSLLSFFLLPLLTTFLCWFTNRHGTGWTLFFVTTGVFIMTHSLFFRKFWRQKNTNSSG